MKKFLLLSLVIAFISIFFSSSYEAKADPPDCPDGYSQTTIQVPVGTNPTCNYQVWLCYKCHEKIGSGGQDEIKVEYTILKYMPPASPTCRKTMGEVLSATEKLILNPNYVDQYLCNGTVAPPCEVHSVNLIISVTTKVCWNKYFDPTYGWDGVVVYEQCTDDPTECYRVWRICWNGSDYEYSFFDGPFIKNGPPTCDPDEPEDPVVPYEHSECFQAVTPCNHPELYIY